MSTPILWVILCFVPSGVLSLALEFWQHWHAGEPRAPFKEKLLRPPGESSRRKIEQLDDSINEALIWVIGFPCTLWVCYLSSTGTGAWLQPLFERWVAALGIAAVFFGGFTFKLISLINERKNWRLKFTGERAMGEQLNQLMMDGCRVIHDFPLTETSNVDHVVVAPAGVFAVETSMRRKNLAVISRQSQEVLYDGKKLEFPFHTETADLVKVRDQAVELGRLLAKLLPGPLAVRGVLALPGWQVIARGESAVRVLNPKMIEGEVLAPVAEPLSAERIREIASALELKCRDVEF